MISPDGSDDALRIGDREREQAVAILHDAVGAGYLDLSEFEERSRTVYAARTRADLRGVLADLPTGAALLPAPRPRDPAIGPAASGVEPQVFDCGWSTVKRRGTWQVPGYLVLSGTMGGADLDLRTAVLPPGGTVVEVDASWSTIKLRLGPDQVVRTDEYSGGSMSSLKDKAGAPRIPGGPVITLRGGAAWTTVVLRRG